MDIAILASGSGSNLQALIDHQASYRIVLVLSDRAHSRALQRAVDAGIPTALVDWSPGRESATHEVCEMVKASGAEAVVLAGFMRILGPEAVRRFPSRIINIHPSLLPAFPGGEAVPAALEHGVKVTGLTVHFVDEQVDHGPIIAQVPVAVADADDEASLHRRIQLEEHRLYPEVVAALARGEIQVEGRNVRWERS